MPRPGKGILVLFVLLIAGCATPKWTQVGGEYRNAPLKFLVDLPQGWMRVDDKNGLMVTREGFPLQMIFVNRHDISKPLAHTKKKILPGMLPQEVAEVALDQFHSNPGYKNLEILENRPATIGGQSGFRAVFTDRSEKGLRSKEVFCGFLLKDQFYFLRYIAPQRYYFDRDLETFENVVRSFRLIQDS